MLRPFEVNTSNYARTYGAAQFPIYDGHGNMKATLSRSGSSPWYAISNSRSYDVWGGVRDGSSTGDPNGRYCANLGHKQDDELASSSTAGDGLIYMRARYYEPGTGRFVSEDPARDGLNWYVYCGNDPVSNLDPSGRSLVSEFIAFIGFALIAFGTYRSIMGSLQYMEARRLLVKIMHQGNLREGLKRLSGVSTEEILLLQHGIELLEGQYHLMQGVKAAGARQAITSYLMVLLGFLLWGPVSEFLDPYSANDGFFGYAPW